MPTPRLLVQRNLTSYWRSPNYNLIRMLTTIGFGLIFGTLYYKLGSDRWVGCWAPNFVLHSQLPNPVVFLSLSINKSRHSLITIIDHQRLHPHGHHILQS